MKAKQWEKRIREQTEAVGTYREAFEDIIKTLSTVLEQRDIAYAEYVADGRAVIDRTSDRGAVNLAKNPKLSVWQELNTQALAYWRELGLTAAGLKRIDEQSMKTQKPKKSLEDVLTSIGL